MYKYTNLESWRTGDDQLGDGDERVVDARAATDAADARDGHEDRDVAEEREHQQRGEQELAKRVEVEAFRRDHSVVTRRLLRPARRVARRHRRRRVGAERLRSGGSDTERTHCIRVAFAL